ncbi:hypothetical protein AVEN_234505-1 [Araneus ventricosus]|uniref:Uncharacterized protein n=1 Tax=Araneus ventricosus TaxID=182803 RepID=A0A4Y2A8Q1_ARAVE|nr:hypothetical protein AVEN_234505-1 [Araneus ventricosus]
MEGGEATIYDVFRGHELSYQIKIGAIGTVVGAKELCQGFLLVETFPNLKYRPSQSNGQECQSAYLLYMYFGRFGPLCHEGLGLSLFTQYFKSANEDPVCQVPSKSRSMLTGQFVTCILGTLVHPALRDWVRTYLSLHYFKSADEEPVHRNVHQSSEVCQPVNLLHVFYILWPTLS